MALELLANGADPSAEVVPPPALSGCWGGGTGGVTTALHVACVTGNTGLARALMEHGADITVLDSLARLPMEARDDAGCPEDPELTASLQCSATRVGRTVKPGIDISESAIESAGDPKP